MTSREEEEQWRSIVEHYGERPRLDAEPPEAARAAAGGEPSVGTAPEHDPYAPAEPPQTSRPAGEDDEERFVPPPPPPLPHLPWPRRLAWTVVLGAPVLVVLLALLGATVSTGAGVLVALTFVGAFGYLVATMDPDPRDPWDDGSAV